MKSLFICAFLVTLALAVTFSPSHLRRYRKKGCDGCQTKHYDPLHNIFTVEFDHAARNGVRMDSNTFKVSFNGQTVKDFNYIANYNVQHSRLSVRGKFGKNSIHFIATGISDGLGQQISNFKLHRLTFCGYENVAVNGEFKEGHNLGHGWNIWRNGQFKGWNCNDEIEVGWGQIYNPRWPYGTYVSELDTNHNSDIYQEFWLDKYYRIDED